MNRKDQIMAVRREVADRRRNLPRLVTAGAITEQKAADEIAAMEAVLETLEGLGESSEPARTWEAA